MAVKLAYDLVAASGEYKDKSGATKKRWVQVGKMFENDRGYFISLEPHINLAGLMKNDHGQVIVSCFEPKQPGAFGAPAASRPAPSQNSLPDFEDDIPFN